MERQGKAAKAAELPETILSQSPDCLTNDGVENSTESENKSKKP